jgi:hypothetical protein
MAGVAVDKGKLAAPFALAFRPSNLTHMHEERNQLLADFAAWVKQYIKGDEKARPRSFSITSRHRCCIQVVDPIGLVPMVKQVG